MSIDYKQKYLKYKMKYTQLKQLSGGANDKINEYCKKNEDEDDCDDINDLYDTCMATNKTINMTTKKIDCDIEVEKIINTYKDIDGINKKRAMVDDESKKKETYVPNNKVADEDYLL
jgi:hypothetical protein